jgi:hypothetical protein
VLLLLIGCGNASILLLARVTVRQHEIAVRAAIVASRARIVCQLLTESILLAFAGAGLGALLAYKSLSVIVANLPVDSFPNEAAIRINLPVLLFSVGLAAFTGLLFGLWPALQLARTDAGQVMHSTTRRISGSAQGRRMHAALIGGQIALTLFMIASAAMQSFIRLLRVPLGYAPHYAMSTSMILQDGAYPDWAGRSAYFELLRSTVAEVPGVTEVAISINATPPENGEASNFEILGRPTRQDQPARIDLISPEYFSVLRVPLVEGRIWDQAEGRAAAVAVVNQSFARKYFPGSYVLGRSIKLPSIESDSTRLVMAPTANSWLSIVGVVADKRNDGLENPILPEIYVPNTFIEGMGAQILVRSRVPLFRCFPPSGN